MDPQHIRARSDTVDRSAIEAALRVEADGVHSWSNGPHDRYAAHDHAYRKILYCLDGSIDFVLADGRTIAMRAGDRLVIPPRTAHSAVVGPDGVTCIEGRAR
jgi:mannose-6-phosphate isomerase-like protein (cupin superfamily)